jgi:hypothetical protein
MKALTERTIASNRLLFSCDQDVKSTENRPSETTSPTPKRRAIAVNKRQVSYLIQYVMQLTCPHLYNFRCSQAVKLSADACFIGRKALLT